MASGFSAEAHASGAAHGAGHRGMNYAAPRGAPVIAVPMAGCLLRRSTTPAAMVRVRHGLGYSRSICRLSAFRKESGQASVNQGGTVGRMGWTGLATGPHLHFGLAEERRLREPAARASEPPLAAGRSESRHRPWADFKVEHDRALAAARKLPPRRHGLQRHPLVLYCQSPPAAPLPPQRACVRAGDPGLSRPGNRGRGSL